MDNIKIKGETRTCGESQGYNQLSVRDQLWEGELNGSKVSYPEMVTEWKLSTEERNQIALGGTVQLSMLGISPAPVMLSVAPPELLPWGSPFDVRLARTPYLVIPKLALQAMPQSWQLRFEGLMQEMEDAGIDRTTSYYCFVKDSDGSPGQIRNKALDRGEYDPAKAFYVFVNRNYVDPWANYRHGDIMEVAPNFKLKAKKEEVK